MDKAKLEDLRKRVEERPFVVKVRGHGPEVFRARNRSAAKYAAGRALIEAEGRNNNSPMTIAWYRVEWVRLAQPSDLSALEVSHG